MHIFAYADDIILVGRSTGVLKEAVVNLCKEAKEMGLKSICKKLNLKG
jgi:hypothetical protein